MNIVLPDVLLYKGNPAFRGAVSTNSELTDWIFSSSFDFAFPDVHVVNVQLMVAAILMICSRPYFSFMVRFKCWALSFRGPSAFDRFACELPIEYENFWDIFVWLFEVSHAILFDPALQNIFALVVLFNFIALSSHYLARSSLEGHPLSLRLWAIL